MIQLSTDLLIFKFFNIGQKKKSMTFGRVYTWETFRFVLLCAVLCLIEKKLALIIL